MPGDERGGKPEAQIKKASFWNVVRTVVFAFFGVRKSTQHEKETVHLKPVQIIVAGLIGALVLVTSLLLLVRFIIGRATG
jgi:hypothetical protein